MRGKVAVALLLALLAILAGTSTAKAVVSPGMPSLVCGSEGCGDGGSTNCFWDQRESSGGDWTGGTVTAHLHWCIDWNGNMWDVYGYSTHNNPCCEPWLTFGGYQYDYGTGNGHFVYGQFQANVPAPPLPWLVTIHYDYVSVGICADGWGNVWQC